MTVRARMTGGGEGGREALGLRHALSKLAPLRGRFGALAVSGGDAESLEEQARALGWKVDPSARLLVEAAEEDGAAIDGRDWEGREVVAVLGGGMSGGAPRGWRRIAARPMKEFRPLGEWCAGLGRRCGLPEGVVNALGHLLERAGVAGVVGSRLCATNHPVNCLHVLAAETAAVRSLRPAAADRFRDACMSVLGIGHIPLFAANFASLATVLLAGGMFLLAGEPAMRIALVVLAAVSTVLGVAFERWSAGYYFAEDAREVVIDEVAGMSVVLLFLPSAAGWPAFAAAFVLFRFFDIFKWGVHWIEDRPWAGVIVWDDLLAGLYAGIVLAVAARIF